MKKLCIDPGHGMSNIQGGRYDPGACAAGLSEADIVLQWALTAKWMFKQAGIEIFLTRDDDSDPNPVSTRDNRANAAGCTHFISLHCNAGPMSATGTETFYRNSKEFAKTINRIAVNATQLHDRGIKSEVQSQHPRLAVLRFVGEACLVETGFITSAKDRKVLISRDVRMAFGHGLLEWFKRLR